MQASFVLWVSLHEAARPRAIQSLVARIPQRDRNLQLVPGLAYAGATLLVWCTGQTGHTDPRRAVVLVSWQDKPISS